MTRQGTRSHQVSSLVALAVGALLLSACSLDLDPEPTAVPSPTAVVFGPDDIAVGTLIDEARDAWEQVDAWHSETRIDAGSSDNASGAASTASERVVLPDSRHVLTMNGDTVVTEEIVIGGVVYMRGALVSSSIYPEVEPDTWIMFQPDQVPPDTVLDQRVDYLTAPPAFPFETVTAETRALPAEPAGETQVAGRTCAVWRFSTTAGEGEGFDFAIAFDARDRPCELVRSGGGVVETTTWSYPEQPEPITAPEDVVQVDAFPTAP